MYNKFVKKYLNQIGGASVIVVVFLLVLIILSLTALMTALSNDRLTDKTKVWLQDYNKLNTRANEKYIEMKNSNIKDVITSVSNGIEYIDYVVYDESVENKWIEVTLRVSDDKLIIEKWLEKQEPFVFNENIEYFDGDFDE